MVARQACCSSSLSQRGWPSVPGITRIYLLPAG
jgi:hypothetical protein